MITLSTRSGTNINGGNLTCPYPDGGVTNTINMGTFGETSYVKDFLNLNLMQWTGIKSIVLANGPNGAGRLDTGAPAVGFYGAYVIGDSTGVNPPVGIFSASFISPTMPAGYNIYRWLGSVYVKSIGPTVIRPFYQTGRSDMRRIFYNEAASGVFAFAGSGTSFTPVSLTSLVSPRAEAIDILAQFDNANVAAEDKDIFLVRPITSSIGFPIWSGTIGIKVTDILGHTFNSDMPVPSTKVVPVILTGTSGTANVTVGGVTRLATFNTNLNTTAADFVTAHTAAYDAAGITLSSSTAADPGRIYFVGKTRGDQYANGSTVNVSGDLAAGAHVRTHIDYKVSKAVNVVTMFIQGYIENL